MHEATERDCLIKECSESCASRTIHIVKGLIKKRLFSQVRMRLPI